MSVGRDTIICAGDKVQLQALGEGTFIWSPASTLDNPNISNPIASPVEETTYQVTLTDDNGCTNTDEIKIKPLPRPTSYAGNDTTLSYTFTYQTSAMDVSPIETGSWKTVGNSAAKFSDITNPVNTISALSVGENIFKWIVDNGVCPVGEDILIITVNNLEIPTLITPNEDGINERFELRGIQSLGKTELIIFDRGGLMMYKNADYDNSWNGVDQSGNPLPDDTYYFSIKPTNGKSVSGYIVIRR